MSEEDKSQNGGWRLDRHITLAVILAVALETAGAMVWAGMVHERIRQLETEVSAQAPVAERLARLEEQTDFIRAAIARVEARLEDQRPQ